MSSSSLGQSEKHRLLSAWQADELTPEYASRLLLAAQADPELCREMADLQTIERLLRHQGTLAADGDLFTAEVIARLKAASESDRSFATAVIDRLQRAQLSPTSRGWPRKPLLRPIVWATAIGMLLAISLALGRRLFTPSLAATVAGLEAVRWAPDQPPLLPGQRLPRGIIKVESGFLKLQFDSQASLIVEGRARLEILGRNAARLYCGRAAAFVPDLAKGFILESPEGRVIDLGTRFGVEVDDQGNTEVHVLQGLVHTAVRGEACTRELHASQGLRMIPGNVTPIEADQSRFLTALPPPLTGSLAYVHWSFDEGQGAVAHDSGTGLGQGNATARLISYTANAPGPSWVAGRFGTALEFNGVDQYVATDFHGIAGAQARTVACWVRVPRNASPANGFSIVSWGIKHPGEAWQVAVNSDPDAGPVGRLRASVHRGAVVGTRDLRDGQWHHIAVVLYDGAPPRDTTHILLFVDGQLEPAYRKSVHEVRTGGERAEASNVMLGRHLSPLGQRVFRGAIDEVFIFDAALSQEAIRHLMLSNQPVLPQRETR